MATALFSINYLMSLIENPFLNNKTVLTHYDELEGKNVDIEQKNVSKYYTNRII